MRILWAPWRIVYVTSCSSRRGCIFCDKIKEDNDEENLILYRGKYSFVMMNLYPYNNGHLLIAPYEHVPDLVDLNKETLLELMYMVKGCIHLLKEVMRPDGFNIGINIGRVAGAGFEEHVHIHIVPRWLGDTNFMPVIGDVKVIPEGLKETYRRLKARIEILGKA
ncbi:MAG: HIT family hydrolase [Thermoprotei archaeon]|nr:MAG: HIT family hydrolase [Thermoprotei archaeon]